MLRTKGKSDVDQRASKVRIQTSSRVSVMCNEESAFHKGEYCVTKCASLACVLSRTNGFLMHAL